MKNLNKKSLNKKMAAALVAMTSLSSALSSAAQTEVPDPTRVAGSLRLVDGRYTRGEESENKALNVAVKRFMGVEGRRNGVHSVGISTNDAWETVIAVFVSTEAQRQALYDNYGTDYKILGYPVVFMVAPPAEAQPAVTVHN